MFKKVLIANRGVCAVRIIKTLKRLNIQSIAIYTEEDEESLHVKLADEAYCLGSGPAKNTYLNIDKILEIAEKANAEVIHPGYGFVSENVDFVTRCEKQGIVFIGPTVEQIKQFGLKHKANELALNNGVPLSPGSGILNDINQAKEEAQKIGYPVILKSTAGGGGIGMQICFSDRDLEESFESIKRLSLNNFANADIFLEKYIQKARHLEVQIIGDGKGEVLAIGERDCSTQRRNQKVVEECPAPNLKDSVRKGLYLAAEKLLDGINYRNAGTVEFVYDVDSEQFYFLELNARLQVEHGVTETVYGIDVVEWMLLVAAGEIDLAQKRAELNPKGHSIEVRIYAEDPYQNFQPCSGLLSEVVFPENHELRIDACIETGIEVSPFFDPMLANIIVYGDDRDQALQLLEKTLEETSIYGIETNQEYLLALLQDPVMQSGKMTTRYLNDFTYSPSRIDILQGGALTTVQDSQGRIGYWHVGIPPSGPMDSYSFRLANRLLGNDENDAGLEITIQGPTLKFSCDTQIVIAGAEI